jgi:hypothetical protein
MFADDAPEKKRATIQLFAEIQQGKYEIYISETVDLEVSEANDEKRSKLYNLIEQHQPVFLELSEEVYDLASLYVANGVLQQKHFHDLLHLSFASVYGLNALVSWNLKHLVKMKTQVLANASNQAQGYREVQIRTPEEVIDSAD